MQIGYLISSCIGYERPLGALMDSLFEIMESWEGKAVIGGYPAHEDRLMTSLRAYVPHISYDYTALIDLVEYPADYPDWTHVFLLHDTMQLGPQSDALIRQADPALQAVAVWGGQCNLALYRVDYLLSQREQLLRLKNCTKQQAVEAEGFLWRQLPAEQRGAYGGSCEVLGIGQPYGQAERIKEYYSGVDVIKWKANWGQTGQNYVRMP